jgi:hypothetical protein
MAENCADFAPATGIFFLNCKGQKASATQTQ